MSRFELSRYGASRFEIVDTEARPTAHRVLILETMPISHAEDIVHQMNSRRVCPVCEDSACQSMSMGCGK